MITVVGSINYDLVTTVSRVPKGGETVHAQTFETHRGGKGANEALACARLSEAGCRVKMIGCVGRDQFGEDLIEHLNGEGIDTSSVQQHDDVRTGVATIIVETTGENRILVYPGANGKVSADQVTTKSLEGSRFVLLQNEIPLETTLSALRLAHNSGKATVWNPSPLPEVSEEIWQYVDYLIVNEGEAAVITGMNVENVGQAKEAVIALLSMGVRVAIVTLGHNGSVYGNSKENIVHCAATKVSPVDTTGAGDTFLGAFVAALCEKRSIDESVSYASRASAIAVTRAGAGSSIPKRGEIIT